MTAIVAVLMFIPSVKADEETSAQFFMRDKIRMEAQMPNARIKGRKYDAPARIITDGPSLLNKARQYVGMKNMTGFRGPWCGAFMGMIARQLGIDPPKEYKLASAWTKAGTRISRPEVGAVAVMRHHVGIVAGVEDGKILLVSGNHNHRVGEGLYAQRKVIAYIRL
jgi:uncharacterized protein (TIGR02594 family)